VVAKGDSNRAEKGEGEGGRKEGGGGRGRRYLLFEFSRETDLP